MQSPNLKKLLLFVNLLVLFYSVLEFLIPWLLGGLNRDVSVLGVWILSYILIYVCNYFFITPYTFRNGFSVKKLLVQFILSLSVYVFVAFLLRSWIYTWEINKDYKLMFSFSYHVTIIQAGLFYFLFSTGMRVIQMHIDNQIMIKDLASERSKIELENLQTNVESDLISRYISYLQDKNERYSVSEEIVELSDFLRYTTYRDNDKRAPFQSELKELNRFKEVLAKSDGPELTIENDIQTNPLVPVFGLLTPLKELLVKLPELKVLTVFITGTGAKVKMIMKSKDVLKEGLSFELSHLNKENNQLEVEII